MDNFDGQTIEIMNWEKYNPKRDQSTYTWLRLNNDIATDRKLFGLSPEQRYAWIVILCEVSKENKATYEVDLAFLQDLTKVDLEHIVELFDHLRRKGIIKIAGDNAQLGGDNARPPAVANVSEHLSHTTPTYVRTNVTNYIEQLSCSRVKNNFDLEKLYQGYPRKKGKTPGLKKLAKEILTLEDYDQLAAAISNYAKDVSGKEPEYIKHFSTFAGQWRDWIHIEPDSHTYSINVTSIDLDAS